MAKKKASSTKVKSTLKKVRSRATASSKKNEKPKKKLTVGVDPTKPIGRGNPPAGGHRFKKGKSGNPLGGKLHKPRLSKLLNKITGEALSEAIELAMLSTPAEVNEIIKDPETPLATLVILRAASDAANHGNFEKFNLILERVLGKVPNRVDHTTNGESINTSPVSINNVSPEVLKFINSKAEDDC